MKQGRGRTRGNNRRRTNGQPPAVICLPGPKQPLPLPRKEPEALRAFSMTAKPEPLAFAPLNERIRTASPAKPTRTRAKQNGASAATEMAVSMPPVTPRIAEVGSTSPLPRSRALVVAPQKGLVVLKTWLRKLIMKPKKARLSIETASAKTQVRALRVEVAQLQRSLDQLMAQLKALQ